MSMAVKFQGLWRLRLLLARWGILQPGKIMYIGGSDTLPPPLSREEEAALLDRLSEEGALRGKKKESIAIGQGFKGVKGELGVGSCTGCFECSLKGCPPAAADIVRFLRENWQ